VKERREALEDKIWACKLLTHVLIELDHPIPNNCLDATKRIQDELEKWEKLLDPIMIAEQDAQLVPQPSEACCCQINFSLRNGMFPWLMTTNMRQDSGYLKDGDDKVDGFLNHCQINLGLKANRPIIVSDKLMYIGCAVARIPL
jgi:hypothetical protein